MFKNNPKLYELFNYDCMPDLKDSYNNQDYLFLRFKDNGGIPFLTMGRHVNCIAVTWVKRDPGPAGKGVVWYDIV